MKLTNKLGLPQPIVDAVKNDSYDGPKPGGKVISATALLRPPRLQALEAMYWDQLEEDASERIWSLMGQVCHGILERADTTGVAERRLEIEVEGWTVSGQMDRYHDGLLQDYKVVTAYKLKGGEIPREYVEQANIYAVLLRRHGFPVTKAEIVGILRDWSKMEARREPSYPQRQVVLLNAPLWLEKDAEKFVRDRVILHQQARVTLPECSTEERWAKPSVYAVMKTGRKTAVKLCETEAEAKIHCVAADYFVVKRSTVNTRCENYCSVSEFCSQFQQSQQKEAV